MRLDLDYKALNTIITALHNEVVALSSQAEQSLDEDDQADLYNDSAYCKALKSSLCVELEKHSQSLNKEANTKSIKFYIASSLARRGQVSNLIKTLEEKGHTCTLDWTTSVLSESSPTSARKAQLNAELEAVKQADLLIALPPLGRGSHGELGAAAILNKPIFYIGEEDKTCLLYEAFSFVPTLEDFLLIIEGGSV